MYRHIYSRLPLPQSMPANSDKPITCVRWMNSRQLALVSMLQTKQRQKKGWTKGRILSMTDQRRDRRHALLSALYPCHYWYPGYPRLILYQSRLPRQAVMYMSPLTHRRLPTAYGYRCPHEAGIDNHECQPVAFCQRGCVARQTGILISRRAEYRLRRSHA